MESQNIKMYNSLYDLTNNINNYFYQQLGGVWTSLSLNEYLALPSQQRDEPLQQQSIQDLYQ